MMRTTRTPTSDAILCSVMLRSAHARAAVTHMCCCVGCAYQPRQIRCAHQKKKLFLHAPAAPPPSLRTHARMKPNLPLFLSARFQPANVTAAAAYAGDMAELVGLAASLPPLPLLPPWLAAAARVSWLVACVAAVALALLALLRAYLDNGGVIPLGKRCEPGLLPSFGACCDACAAPRVPAQTPTACGQPLAPFAAAASAPARRDGVFCAAFGKPFCAHVSCALTHLPLRAAATTRGAGFRPRAPRASACRSGCRCARGAHTPETRTRGHDARTCSRLLPRRGNKRVPRAARRTARAAPLPRPARA
jgi:hypothetical protein